MKNCCLVLVLGLVFALFANASEGYRVVPLGEIPQAMIQQIRAGIAAKYLPAASDFEKSPVLSSVKAYRVFYRTSSPGSHKKDIWTSGLLLVPTGDPKKARKLVSWQHGTEVESVSVPSNSKLLGKDFGMLVALYAATGNVVVAADYPGLGFSPANDPSAPQGNYLGYHPYLNANVEAGSAMDLVQTVTAMKQAQAPELGSTRFSGSLYLTGYSQGGHSTLALHRLFDTHPELEQATGMHLKKSIPMAGPYSLSEYSLDWLIQVVLNDEQPGQSYEPSRGSIFTTYLMTALNKYCADPIYQDESQTFSTPVRDQLRNKSILNGTTTWDETMKIIPLKITDVFQREYFEKVKSEKDHGKIPVLQSCLAKQDLTDHWAPKNPVVLIHADRDLDVQYANAILAKERLNQASLKRGEKPKVQLITLRGLSHVTGAMPAIFTSFHVINASE